MATISKTVDIKITPKEAAQIFCEMDADQQAEFFNQIDEEVKGWSTNLSFQLQAIIDSEKLKTSGKTVMALIGEYGWAKSSKEV